MENSYDFYHGFTREDIKSIIAQYINKRYASNCEPKILPDDVHINVWKNEDGSWDLGAHTSMHRVAMNEKV